MSKGADQELFLNQLPSFLQFIKIFEFNEKK